MQCTVSTIPYIDIDQKVESGTLDSHHHLIAILALSTREWPPNLWKWWPRKLQLFQRISKEIGRYFRGWQSWSNVGGNALSIYSLPLHRSVQMLRLSFLISANSHVRYESTLSCRTSCTMQVHNVLYESVLVKQVHNVHSTDFKIKAHALWIILFGHKYNTVICVTSRKLIILVWQI